jgi:hypothetical protein
MQLSALTTDEIRSSVKFGASGTPYIEGELIERIPNGLHRIRGVFAVDVTNAVRYDEPNAWQTVLNNGEIRTRT